MVRMEDEVSEIDTTPIGATELEAACRAFNDAQLHITFAWEEQHESTKQAIRKDMRKALESYEAARRSIDVGGVRGNV